jgi:hypothetical protein
VHSQHTLLQFHLKVGSKSSSSVYEKAWTYSIERTKTITESLANVEARNDRPLLDIVSRSAFNKIGRTDAITNPTEAKADIILNPVFND